MLKKLSIIFIKIAPIWLGVSAVSRMILPEFGLFKLPVALDFLDRLFIFTGFIILSHTFKFCIYHRILLYFMIVGYLFCFLDFLMQFESVLVTLIWVAATATMIATLVIIRIYVKKYYKK